MADYVVRLNGQDNLSPTINSVKQALNGVGSTSTGLDKIREKFIKIENSTAPLKRKLRDIKDLMAKMNLSGDANTPLYTQMAEAAGNYADAVADASDATKRFASDTMSIDAGIQAFQGIAAAGAVATGVMGLFGSENKKVEQAILKVQSAIAILNGVQSIANVLNKDSVLMQKLKNIQIKISTANTIQESAALGANTTATAINSAATKTSTIAQNAWNTAKAIAKALLGDFTGLAIVAAGALITYALCTDQSTDAQEKNNTAVNKAKEIFDNYHNSVATNAGNLVGKFQQLKYAYSNLKSEAEKTKWIKENATEFSNLGLKVNDVTSAENVFVRNSAKVVKALELRAKAMAAQQMMVDAYSDYYKQVMQNSNSVAGGGYYKIAKEGQNRKEINKQDYDNWFTYARGQYGAAGVEKLFDGNKFTKEGAASFNSFSAEQARARLTKNNAEAAKSLDKALGFAQKIIISSQNAIDNLGIEDIFTTSKEIEKKSGGSGKNNMTKEAQTILEQYKEYGKKVQEIQEKFNAHFIDSTQAKKELDDINNEIKEKFGENIKLYAVVGLDDESIYDELQNMFKAIQSKFDKGIITEAEARNAVDDINKKLEEALGGKGNKFELKVEVVTDSDTYRKFKSELAKIQSDYEDGIISKEAAEAAVANLNEELKATLGKGNELKLKLKDEDIVKGVDELYDELEQRASKWQTKFNRGLVNKKEALNEIEKINQEIDKLGGKRIKLEIESNINNVFADINKVTGVIGSVDNLRNSFKNLSQQLSESGDAWDKFIGIVNVATGVITTIQSVVEAYNVISSIFTAKKVAEGIASTTTAAEIATSGGIITGAQTAQSTSNAVATASNKVLEASYLDLASAMYFAAHAEIPFAGFGIAAGFVSAMMGAMAAQHAASLALAAFADGGIVQGTTYHGDAVLARLNAGEMVLNQKQIGNLFRMLDSGNSNQLSGNVKFEITGDKLYGVLNNYNKKMNRVR